LINLNDYPRALADYDAAIALEPGDAYGFTVRGNAKLDSGNPAGALADYNEALRIKPDYAFARENRAYAYFNTGDYKRAVEELTFVIDDEPTARLHVRRGHAHAMLEDRDRELASSTRTGSGPMPTSSGASSIAPSRISARSSSLRPTSRATGTRVRPPTNS
jgi:tetratricopeptide (TPR) repeat protein